MDDWELRCRFNHGRYVERMQAGELIQTTGRKGTPSPLSGQPANTTSHMVYYLDPRSRKTIAEVHQFVLSDGSVGASGHPDPKMLLIGDFEYHKIKGRYEAFRDPSLLLPAPIQWLYKVYRKACCSWFGPDRDKKMALPINKLIHRFIGEKSSASGS